MTTTPDLLELLKAFGQVPRGRPKAKKEISRDKEFKKCDIDITKNAGGVPEK
jgi:hypothetical protein